MSVAESRPGRKSVPADLHEATPGAAGQWLLASPLLVFLAWTWLDLFRHYSPIPWLWLDSIIGGGLLLLAVVLPLGLLAHRAVTSLPRLFQNAGWDVHPVEPVRDAEKYLVKYEPRARHRAATTWGRLWLRAAQGWVYLEILVVLLGGLLLIPIFLSASRFGFGS